MVDGDEYWAPRRCLLARLPEHETAADRLSDAADAIVAGHLERAHDLVRQADLSVLFECSSIQIGL